MASLTSTLQAQQEEQAKKEDELYKQIQDSKNQLQVTESNKVKLQSQLDDKSDKLTAALQKIKELETTVVAKVIYTAQLILTALPYNPKC